MEFIQPSDLIPDNARTLYEALRSAKEEAIEICRKQSEILLKDSSSFRSEEQRIVELERMDRAYDKARRLIRCLKEKYEDVRVQLFKDPKASAPVFKARTPDRRNGIPSNVRRCLRTPSNKIPILLEIASAPKVKGQQQMNKIDLALIRRCMQKIDCLEDPRTKKRRF